MDWLFDEIKNTSEDEIYSKFQAWSLRCRAEGISIYALERLIQLQSCLNDRQPRRSMVRYRKCTCQLQDDVTRENTEIAIDNPGKIEIAINHGLWNKIKRMVTFKIK